MPKFKPTAYIVAAFVVVMIFLFATEDAYGQSTDYRGSGVVVSTGLGFGVANYSGGVTQRIGVESGDSRYLATYERLGGKGYRNVNSISLVRRVRHERTGLAGSIGLAYFDRTVAEHGSKSLVSERLTFTLGLDYTWSLSSSTGLRLGLVHNSTAGRSERNRGVDRVNLSFLWRNQ